MSLGYTFMMESQRPFNALEICGLTGVIITAVFSLIFLFRFCVCMYETWFGHLIGRGIKVENMGKWAVITGASDGIGKALAHEIAKRKVNVVLISLTQSKLRATAEEIKAKYNVETKVIAVDFTHGYEVYKDVKSQLEGLEIGTLINNVGILIPQTSYFHKISDRNRQTLDMIHCNIFSMQFMTSMILPQMVERQKGLIVNLSSVTAKMTIPFLSVYSATKAYIDKQTACLSLEYSNSGVHIQSLTTGGVATKLNILVQRCMSDFCNPAPEVYAREVMKTLGMSSDATPYLPHTVMRFVYRQFRNWLPAITKTVTKYYMKRQFIKGQHCLD